MKPHYIILVSRLPRSGTSMMMKMLETGVAAIVTDHVRQTGSDNPQGYYGVEPVKQLQTNSRWLHYMRGKTLKIVSSPLFYLPLSLPYKIIFCDGISKKFLCHNKKCLTIGLRNMKMFHMLN